MKKFWWLLVLPYLVVCEGNECILKIRVAPNETNPFFIQQAEYFQMTCAKGKDSDCAWLYDIADMLNESHERRTHPKNEQVGHAIYVVPNEGKPFIPKDNSFDYKAACGQDDCGKEP